MSRATFARSPAGWTRVTPVATLLALAACSAGSLAPGGSYSSGGTASLETQTACRQRASEIYDQRNRGDIYAANSSMNTPFSANYQSGASSRELADQFTYGRMQNECERNTGTGADRSGETAVAPAPAPARTR